MGTKGDKERRRGRSRERRGRDEKCRGRNPDNGNHDAAEPKRRRRRSKERSTVAPPAEASDHLRLRQVPRNMPLAESLWGRRPPTAPQLLTTHLS